MISTGGALIRELQKDEDDFITVRFGNREYVIEGIGRIYENVDRPTSHRCIDIRDGGEGFIKR